MIYLGFFDTGGGLPHCPPEDFLGKTEVLRLAQKKGEAAKSASLAVRHLLHAMCIKIGEDNQKCLQISYTDRGKPYFANSAISFSLSHDGSMCFAALSDEGDVGCDVQSMPVNREVLRRALSRFKKRDRAYAPFENHAELPEYSFLFYECREGSLRLLPESAGIALLSAEPCLSNHFVIDERPMSADEDMLAEWCSLEAEAKLSGKGLSSENADEQDSMVKTFFILHGENRYAAAFAVKHGT